jgi:TerB N-terminal domain
MLEWLRHLLGKSDRKTPSIGRRDPPRASHVRVQPPRVSQAPLAPPPPAEPPNSPTNPPRKNPPAAEQPEVKVTAAAQPGWRVLVEIKPEYGKSASYPPRSERGIDARWIPPGQSVSVNGFTIADGMVYVGSFMPANPAGGWGADAPAPCLINPSLPISARASDSDMGYWPSYRLRAPDLRKLAGHVAQKIRNIDAKGPLGINRVNFVTVGENYSVRIP